MRLMKLARTLLLFQLATVVGAGMIFSACGGEPEDDTAVESVEGAATGAPKKGEPPAHPVKKAPTPIKKGPTPPPAKK
jgi:hypothetical protein